MWSVHVYPPSISVYAKSTTNFFVVVQFLTTYWRIVYTIFFRILLNIAPVVFFQHINIYLFPFFGYIPFGLIYYNLFNQFHRPWWDLRSFEVYISWREMHGDLQFSLFHLLLKITLWLLTKQVLSLLLHLLGRKHLPEQGERVGKHQN